MHPDKPFAVDIQQVAIIESGDDLQGYRVPFQSGIMYPAYRIFCLLQGEQRIQSRAETYFQNVQGILFRYQEAVVDEYMPRFPDGPETGMIGLSSRRQREGVRAVVGFLSTGLPGVWSFCMGPDGKDWKIFVKDINIPKK